jgi:hypothetical protein
LTEVAQELGILNLPNISQAWIHARTLSTRNFWQDFYRSVEFAVVPPEVALLSAPSSVGSPITGFSYGGSAERPVLPVAVAAAAVVEIALPHSDAIYSIGSLSDTNAPTIDASTAGTEDVHEAAEAPNALTEHSAEVSDTNALAVDASAPGGAEEVGDVVRQQSTTGSNAEARDQSARGQKRGRPTD